MRRVFSTRPSDSPTHSDQDKATELTRRRVWVLLSVDLPRSHARRLEGLLRLSAPRLGLLQLGSLVVSVLHSWANAFAGDVDPPVARAVGVLRGPRVSVGVPGVVRVAVAPEGRSDVGVVESGSRSQRKPGNE